jgi:RNA polymerase sigma-70 factor (ECF subfamily)
MSFGDDPGERGGEAPVPCEGSSEVTGRGAETTSSPPACPGDDPRESSSAPQAVIYSALYGIAKPLMDDERDDHTLQTTAVVHEAWLRLREQPEIKAGPSHADFGRIAANSIRQILVDHARHRSRLKRGGGWRRISLEQATDTIPTRQRDVDLLDLDDAMTSLEQRSARQCRVIEMRFFAGMSNPEIADALGVCTKTVTDDWNAGRAFLLSRIAVDAAR